MTRNKNVIFAAALALGACVGTAQDQPLTTSDQQSSGTEAQNDQVQIQQLQLFDSSRLENQTIADKQGQKLGKLERLLIDGNSGRVRFAVIQVDKEWNLNDPEVIVPFGLLQISRQADQKPALMLDVTRDRLLNAPKFEQKLVHQLTTREAGMPIYSYWGITWHDDDLKSTAGSSRTTTSEASRAANTSSTAPGTNAGASSATSGSGSTGQGTVGSGATRGGTVTTPGITGGTDQFLGNPGSNTSLDSPSRTQHDVPERSSPTTDEQLKPKDQSSEPRRDLGGNETD